MRIPSLIVAVLLLTACDAAPMGASEDAPPPADAPVAVGPDYSGDFDAAGTEPFWTVKVRTEGLTLTRPDQADVTTANPGPRADGDQGVFDASAGERRLVLRLTPGDCTDGMSGRHYGYLAEIWIDGETLKGCAARPPPAATQN